MKRMIVVSLCLLMLISCSGSKAGSLQDLQKSNEDLTRRVKALEDELLEAQKKQIQQDQAIQAMHEQVRDMENVVNKIQLTPAR